MSAKKQKLEGWADLVMEKDILALGLPADTGLGQCIRDMGGPTLDYSPEPISPMPVVSPNTISSTERMSTSPCLVIPLSQDLVDVEPVFPVFRMASNLDNSG